MLISEAKIARAHGYITSSLSLPVFASRLVKSTVPLEERGKKIYCKQGFPEATIEWQPSTLASLTP